MAKDGIQFDRNRAIYIGLNKVKDRFVTGEVKINDNSSVYTGSVNGGASLSPAGPLGKISANASATGTRQSVEVTDLSERGQLLAIAPQVFDDVLTHAEPALSESGYEVGRTYYYTGVVRYRLRTHDDHRREGDQENAPRLGLWLIELANGQEAESAESVTWIVLSATAAGQIETQLGGKVSDWRGGSQTEHLFEYLVAKNAGKERKNSDTRWLRHPWIVRSARNMLQDSTPQTVELVFQCLEVADCPISGENAEVSYLGWSPASADREVPVERVILGTPFFIQWTSRAVEDPPSEVKTLRQHFKEYFGI